ncbi:hypothetical protein QTH87_23755 [Variovorax sp. J22P168]|uniref:hypothetical protein n=1 Tax=Variovorax jilinensis TaxID=3053513 RepID=UPI0025791033|nr:hypothetical protein [Variovorax sp. J22P168]MDM0015480.1 hypothetical protein [Variovorax sp. J22P168]
MTGRAATAMDLMLATLQREAVHDRIVRAFAAQALSNGSGPIEDDLRIFASLVVTEQRLARSLGRPASVIACAAHVSDASSQ